MLTVSLNCLFFPAHYFACLCRSNWLIDFLPICNMHSSQHTRENYYYCYYSMGICWTGYRILKVFSQTILTFYEIPFRFVLFWRWKCIFITKTMPFIVRGCWHKHVWVTISLAGIFWLKGNWNLSHRHSMIFHFWYSNTFERLCT